MIHDWNAFCKGDFRNFSVKLEECIKSPPCIQNCKKRCFHPGAPNSMGHVNFLFSISKIPSSFLQLGFMWQILSLSRGMFEFSGNPSATVMTDLPQQLGFSKRGDFPKYINLYLNKLRPMGHRVFCILRPQRKIKDRGTWTL